MKNQEINPSKYKEKSHTNDSNNETKHQVNQKNSDDTVHRKLEIKMDELSNQIRDLTIHLLPKSKANRDESILCDFFQKCENSHADLSKEEFEIAQIYNELLNYPVILNRIDIARHHRIVMKALELNKDKFNYQKFIMFIFESIKNGHYETQSLLVYFNEADFASFWTIIQKLKQQRGFDEHFLSYRNDRYINMIRYSYAKEKQTLEMKTQMKEVIASVQRNEDEIHNFQNENCAIFQEIKNELQQYNHKFCKISWKVINELVTEKHILKCQLEQMKIENDELKKQNEEMIQSIHQNEEKMEELMKSNCQLSDELQKHFKTLNQTIQMQHNQTNELIQSALFVNLSTYPKRSEIKKLQENQATILYLTKKIESFFYYKCPFLQGSKFDGILKYLQHFGGVQLTSGHREYYNCSKVTNLIDYSNPNDTVYDVVADKDTNWIEFNFLTRKIDLSSYQIKSHAGSPGRPHPKTWEIRGSNDRNNWDLLDRRENCSDLNGSRIIKHFKCQSPTQMHYQFIRFVQIENWFSALPFEIQMSRFELYGNIHKT